LRLRTVVRDQGNNAALKDGSVTPEGYSFAFEEVPVLIDAFRRMVRGLEWDVCEMAFATYLCAREHGVAFTAIPAFVMRGFHHGTIVHNPSAGLRSPKDLEGNRVGVNRGYTVTTGVWARGVLEDEHGVDLSRLGWVSPDDAHLAEYRDPANVERPGPGAKPVDRMLLDGDVDAAIPAGDLTKDHPHIRHLLPDPNGQARAWAAKYGTVPVNHYFVVSRALAEARPDVVAEIYRLLQESKRLAPPPADGIDFFPYGVEANRRPLELLVQYAVEQQIIPRAFTVEELFDGCQTLRV